MAVATSRLFIFNCSSRTSTTALFHVSIPQLGLSCFTLGQARKKRKTKLVKSSQSNVNLIKSNRKSTLDLDPYYDYYDEEEEDQDPESEDEGEGEDEDEEWYMDDEFAEPAVYQVNGKRFNSQRKTSAKQGGKRHSNVRRQTNSEGLTSSGQFAHAYNRSWNTERKLMVRKNNDKRYSKLYEDIGLEERWLPLLDYLCTLGLGEYHFIRMYERHVRSLQTNVCSARERLNYLFSVGVRQKDIPRILNRQPQILEYTVENILKPHVDFLLGLGIPSSKIGNIIVNQPSLFSYSIENSLKPTVRYLVEEVGIDEKRIGKVVQLSPQILTQRIDVCWNMRCIFLSSELGASKESVAKMVIKHPQFLHYSIDDGLLPRINFLRSIGLCNSGILKVLTNMTQILSLSLEGNLKPKYLYLINELCNEATSLLSYPMYLTLSLNQRIRPRHKFLVALNKAPNGPFPLRFLTKPDEYFCKLCAGTTVDKYFAFRQQLLLTDFAEKYRKKR